MNSSQTQIRAFLIHLSTNMWEDFYPEAMLKHFDCSKFQEHYPFTYTRLKAYFGGRSWSDTLKCDDAVWRRITRSFAEVSGNLLLVDVGDGVVFRTHPEIACGRAWSPRKLKEELARCRDLGLEVIPKLNFAAGHDAWLHEYSRMVSSARYYRVCRDLIEETIELFDNPRFFHIGMDEETYADQCGDGHAYVVIRQGQLWWDDLNFYCDTVRSVGSRPWMWSDKLWSVTDREYRDNVATDVLQSNWYYHEVFEFPDPESSDAKRFKSAVDAYKRLDDMGYDQIAAASNWAWLDNYPATLAHCSRTVSPERLKGVMMAPWFPTDPASEEFLTEACNVVKETHSLNRPVKHR